MTRHTVAHLINRTPARTINYQAPIDIMSKFFPGVKLRTRLPAKVFGCVAFVHTRSNRLDPRTLRCVFIGYSNTQKGYKCYDPATRRLYVSADVSFRESVMFFSSSIDVSQNVPCNTHSDQQFLYLPSDAIEKSPVIQPTPASTPKVQQDVVDERENQEESRSANDGDDSNVPRHDPGHNPGHDVEQHDQETGKTIILGEQSVQPSLPDDLDWPIAQRKGVRRCKSRPLYPITNYVSYDSIRPGYRDFIYALLSVPVPKNTQEALMSREWKAAMDEEMVALERNSHGSW